MPLVIGRPPVSDQGPLLPGTITAINPTLCLIDGATTAINVITGHPYFPLPGDRVALERFGSNYLAHPVDLSASFNTPDDLWHPVGDPGEPTLQSGITAYTGTNDAGQALGETVRFYRDRAGVVWLEGLLTIPATASFAGMPIFTLPAGYRPAYQLTFTAVCANGIYVIGVDPSGVVYIQKGPGTTAGYLSLDSVSFMAEDGPAPPTWVDISGLLNGASGWSAGVGTFASTLSGATGAPYHGVRYCIDAAGDIHLSGMVAGGSGQNTASILTGLGTPLAGNLDTDVTGYIYLQACATIPGFVRVDLNPGVSSGQLVANSYGANTATAAWLSLDGITFPGGNNPARYNNGVLINAWTVYTASGSYPSLGIRQNKFGTVYLRGLIKGTNNTAADAAPAVKDGPASPNINKLFPAVCGATSGCGACRTDVNTSGVVPGVALYVAQSAGSSTAGFTSLSMMRWSTRRY